MTEHHATATYTEFMAPARARYDRCLEIRDDLRAQLAAHEITVAHAADALAGRRREWLSASVALGAATDVYQVTRDGEPISDPMTENDCVAWLHKQQGQSVDWACRYEGYAIVKIDR